MLPVITPDVRPTLRVGARPHAPKVPFRERAESNGLGRTRRQAPNRDVLDAANNLRKALDPACRPTLVQKLKRSRSRVGIIEERRNNYRPAATAAEQLTHECASRLRRRRWRESH